MPRIAINGYGRIGRCVLRALHERGWQQWLQVVAIDEPAADLPSMAYLTRFDSTHGRFPAEVGVEDGALLVGGRAIPVFHARDACEVDWGALELDLLLECSGSFQQRAQADRYLAAGAPRVLVSHPLASAADVDATIVYGVNHERLDGRERVVSAASCTTNAIVPVLRVLHAAFGIRHGHITTLHSVMNDQPLLDGYHQADLRRTRSAMQSIVPVSTGLARGIDRLMPELHGRIETKAVRVPTLNVSALDTTLQLACDSSVAEVNAVLRAAAGAGPLAGLLGYTELPHASTDFNHDARSGVVDGSLTRLSGARLVNLLIWFDNEWGFANRMLDVAAHWLGRVNARSP